MIFFELTLTDS